GDIAKDDAPGRAAVENEALVGLGAVDADILEDDDAVGAVGGVVEVDPVGVDRLPDGGGGVLRVPPAFALDLVGPRVADGQGADGRGDAAQEEAPVGDQRLI